MPEKAILRTLLELDRWRLREEELRARLRRFRSDDVRAELEKVLRQVAYYEALLQDMKRETRPEGVGDLLRALVRS